MPSLGFGLYHFTHFLVMRENYENMLGQPTRHNFTHVLVLLPKMTETCCRMGPVKKVLESAGLVGADLAVLKGAF